MINRNFNEFKFQHQKKLNQVIYAEKRVNSQKEVLSLIDHFLIDKNSFIFESVEKGVIKGRYTIFGKDPDKIWEFNNNKSFIIDKRNKKKSIKGDPKKIIEDLIENFKFPTPKNLPPICSLISGFFSYDSIRYIEKVPNNNKDDLKLPDVRLMRPRILIIHDNLKKKIFYIVNIFKDEKISNYKKKFEDIKKEISTLQKQSSLSYNFNKNNFPKKIKVTSNTTKKKFLSMVKKAKKYIKIGDIFQVVLSQRFVAKLTKAPLEIYKKLRVTNPSPFMYFFNFPDFQIVGASPEILVRLRNNKITIRPIAGTRPRGLNKKKDNLYAKDLISDKKELSEHLMLLDLGRNDVGRVSKVNTVKVTEKFKIEKYSHVMHIVSNVTGVFNKKLSKFKSLLAGFPAGTVSGAPKIRSMEIIDELESTKRKVYAGGIGYFSANGEFDTCIALRTAVIKNKKFYVQAGAGIVADSKPNNEYKETVNKAKALLSSLK